MSSSEPGDAASPVERALGHVFGDRALLELALTHPSHAREVDGSRGNERLEFLGDAVLDLVVAELLFAAHPDWSEGALTRARASLVNTRSLARLARSLELGTHVRLGKTEQRTDGAQKESILGNLFEALIGAMYLDGGLAPVGALASRLFADTLSPDTPAVGRDAKTRFQEWAHARFRLTPVYRDLGDSGDDQDDQRFTAAIYVGEDCWGQGRGRTKKQAERVAAKEALRRAARDDD